MDTYEKKYNEALERFKSFKEKYYTKDTYFGDVIFDKTGEMQKDFNGIFPDIELRESEDERIKKWLIGYFSTFCNDWTFDGCPTNIEGILAYLEKQKEQKPAEIDEYEIIKKHITEDSLSSEVNKRLTECGWYVTEQKPADKQEYSGLTDLERIIHRGFLRAGVENVPVIIIKETAKECIEQMKPAEWSEEDKAMRDNILRILPCFVGTAECESNPSLSTSYPLYRREIDWLKSLRPQPHWKPTECQMDSLREIADSLPEGSNLEYLEEVIYALDQQKDGDFSWKPSEEQMRALADTLEDMPEHYKPKCTLETLERDLKNL